MLTIAQRRSISTRALFDAAFRKQLDRDPHAALADAIGVALPTERPIEILEETASRWAFVLPETGDIESELPAPLDARSAVENEVYALLRDDPETIETAARDPRTFLFERFGVEVNGVDLRRECHGTTVILVPHRDAREELDDAMLDLVAGGGSIPLNNSNSVGNAKS